MWYAWPPAKVVIVPPVSDWLAIMPRSLSDAYFTMGDAACEWHADKSDKFDSSQYYNPFKISAHAVANVGGKQLISKQHLAVMLTRPNPAAIIRADSKKVRKGDAKSVNFWANQCYHGMTQFQRHFCPSCRGRSDSCARS
jgi:hypothetical protein